MSELLQQTLYMNTEDLSECTEKEGEDENYVQTNFDLMVSDFCTEIMNDGFQIIGKTFAITETKMYAIIQYFKASNLSVVKGVTEGM